MKVKILAFGFILSCLFGFAFSRPVAQDPCPCVCSPTPTPTPSISPTPSVTPSITPTPTVTPTPSPVPTPGPSVCLSGSGPLITLSGDFTTRYRNDDLLQNTRIDARNARWTNASTNSGVSSSVRVAGQMGACISGGEITGTYPLTTTWSTMHDIYGFMIRGAPFFTVEGLRIHNQGDGVYIGSENNEGFTVRGAYMTQIRDDAVQNDQGKPGTVEDCLIDGAYVGFSDQKYAVAPANAVWNIHNNLVRLQVYEQTYVSGKAGHGWFYKTDLDTIKMSLHGNIFFAEAPSIHGGHKLIPEKVVSCKKSDGSPDNVIVWGGSGSYPRPEELATGCFTLTTDRSVWDAAVAAWLRAHGY